MSNLPVPDGVQPPLVGTMLDLTLVDKKCGIIGGGILGCHLNAQILKAARAASVEATIHWAFDSHENTASTRAGAYHAPFNTLDPRMGRWATRAWNMADIYEDLGVSHTIEDAETLYLSNLDPMPLPQGLPSPAIRVDPAAFGFEKSYQSAALVQMGRVFSPPALLEALHTSLSANPAVKVEQSRHFRDIGDIVSWAESKGLRAVFVAAGASAGRLLGHERVLGSLGVLIHVPMSPELGLHNHTVVMDEDDAGSLSYTIPAPALGTIGVGGTVEELFDLPFSPGAENSADFLLFNEEVAFHAQKEAKRIRARLRARFPLMAQVLSNPNLKMTYGLRPLAEEVIMRVLPTSETAGIVIAEIGGLGGSGITIAPAVAEDALALPTLTETLAGPEELSES